MDNSDRVKPNYDGGGIVNLMASIDAAVGGQGTGYVGLSDSGLGSLAEARNILLLVIDGLGYQYLQRQGNSLLHSYCRDRLTSVFPSTTATAIPAFLTGVAPQQHGFTGWFTYFSELGSVLAVLPFCNRLGYSAVDTSALSPMDLSGVTPFVDRIPVESLLLTPDWIADSPFNRAFSGRGRTVPFKGLRGLRRRLGQAVAARSRGRRYIYAYWGEFDALAHEYGVNSPQVLTHFQALDRLFGELLAMFAGTDTLLMVTADHGFIDSTPQQAVALADHPVLAETLMVPLCGEPRLAFCYVHPDRQRAFEAYVDVFLTREMEWVPSEKLLQDGWFGSGEPHPRLRDRIGHYALLPKDNHVITGRLPGERPVDHVGFHGGASPDEMYVPLIYAEC